MTLYFAVNESKRNQHIQRFLNNISSQIDQIKGATVSQTKLIKSLRAQIPVYLAWKESEKQRIQTIINYVVDLLK